MTQLKTHVHMTSLKLFRVHSFLTETDGEEFDGSEKATYEFLVVMWQL